jgi:amidophosphoribosyltransferase
MSRMDVVIAFHAAVSLLRDSGRGQLLDQVYARCKASEALPDDQIENHVKEIYAPFAYDEVSRRIAEMVTPDDCGCKVGVVYQTVEKLGEAAPANNGDWYFSGNYPTPGGIRMVNRAFIKWYENER